MRAIYLGLLLKDVANTISIRRNLIMTLCQVKNRPHFPDSFLWSLLYAEMQKVWMLSDVVSRPFFLSFFFGNFLSKLGFKFFFIIFFFIFLEFFFLCSSIQLQDASTDPCLGVFSQPTPGNWSSWLVAKYKSLFNHNSYFRCWVWH